MSAEDLIETNVFVYLFDETNPNKQRRAENLAPAGWTTAAGASADDSEPVCPALMRRLEQQL